MYQLNASERLVFLSIVAVLIGYGVSAAFHLPQRGTDQIIAAQKELQPRGEATETADAKLAAVSGTDIATLIPASHPPYWMVAPFVVLLGAIATLPLVPAASHWWDNNLHRLYVAGGLAMVTLLYYLGCYSSPMHAHWPATHVSFAAEHGLNWSQAGDVLASAILSEYVPFIVLLFSLYTISGGIRLVGDLRAHPRTNTLFLLAGSVLASIVGTTGAAMILIRPVLETNAERKHVKHTVVFFIFMVCNCGGCLLPTGDPPLLLGYLRGVGFFWTLRLLPEWLFINGMLAVVYFALDYFYYYPRESKADVGRDKMRVHPLRIRGVWPNGVLLLAVVASVAVLDPSSALPYTNWHPWLFLREAAQLALVALSLALGDGHLRRANHFNYAAITEVAVLFFGIFICMQPPLQVLAVEGPRLGMTEPWQYFWASGSLSSVLDNAPTYVVFFETAKAFTESTALSPAVAGVGERLLAALSLGSVFMGANTYIGNGPNFMVKSVAEKSGILMPSFFGYVAYAVVFLVPLWLLTTFLFL
jgi:Na+/H+ antiporter NhaD/arsenite permease-like protein